MRTDLSFDELADFLNGLRAHGFVIGVDRFLAARTLLESTVADDTRHRTTTQLMTLLAPVLCTSAEEQEAFYRLWLEWMGRRDYAAAVARTGAVARALDRFFGDLRFRMHRRVLAVLAIAAATYVAIGDELFDAKPRAAARADAPMRIDSERFDLRDRSIREGPQPVLGAAKAKHKDTAPVALIVPAEPGFYRRHYTSLKLGAAFLPLVACGVWLYVGLIRRRQLERKKAAELPSLVTLRFASPAGELFVDSELRRARRSLRRHRRAGVDELDLAATVDSTLRTGGWFSPVHAVRNVMPEYLVLVERRGVNDQQAHYFDALVDSLVEEGIYVERFSFESSPRICRRADGFEVPVALAELRSLHPDHRLLILGDGVGLFNPLDGAPHRWLDELAGWELRALLTPESVEEGGERHRALRDAGFIVLPARPEGIIRLSRIVASRASDAGRWRSSPYPELLLESGDRWLSTVLPTPATARTLTGQLREYLGDDGYEWLAACALFPTLEWELTLHLGVRLFGTDAMERVLPALVRLPWLRHGVVPEWLRIELVGSLPAASLARMREILHDLLSDPDEVGGRFEFRMAALFRPGKEPRLYDYVASTVLEGGRPRQAAVSIPLPLRRLLSPNDPDRLQLRPVLMTALGLTCLAAMLVLLLNPMSAPIAPSARVSPATVSAAGATIEIVAQGVPGDFFRGAQLVVPGAAVVMFAEARTTTYGMAARLLTTPPTGGAPIDVEVRRGGALIGTFRLRTTPVARAGN